jgi:hypothetical protein
VAVRDATFLYEIDIRDGAPRKATRTASDGSYQSGERALAMLLGVGAGRFVVSSTTEPIRGDLTGTLSELLVRPLAAARGAIAAMTGVRTMELERILLDQDVIDDYLRATPDPARAIIRRLATGASPRQILLAGEAPPSLLEDVLSDLAARCAVRGVEGAGGTDLLTPAVEAALAVLTGALPTRRSLPPNARASILPRPLPSAPAALAAPPKVAATTPIAAPLAAAPPAREQEPASALTQLSSPWPSPHSPVPQAEGAASDTETSLLHFPEDDGGPPSSLEDAVMREISDRSPDPGTVQGGLDLPPIIEPSELRPRSSNPPPPDRGDPDYGDSALLPSIPPDAIVPGATSNEEFAVAPATTSNEEFAGEPATTSNEEFAGEPANYAGHTSPASEDEDQDKQELEPSFDDEPRGVVEERVQRAPPRLASERRLVIVRESSPIPPPPDEEEEKEAEGGPDPSSAATLRPARDVPSPPPEPPKSRGALVVAVLAFLLLGGVVAAVLRMSTPTVEAPATRTTPAMTAAPLPSPPTTAATTATTPPAAPSAASDDIAPGANVPSGFGVLEIAAPAGARVRVDGAEAGTGPLASRVLRAGYHQVRVDQGGRTSQYVVEVRPGKTTHVKSASLP